jgi:hypothetical protein
LSSVNVLSNVIPVEQAQELVKIMRSKDTLTTLCGLTGVETELDFSSQGLGAGEAVLIANDISDMGALTKFDISSNDIRAEGCKALAAGLQGNQVITELNIGSNALGLNQYALADTSGVTTLADIIPDMGALTSLNLSSKYLTGDNGDDMSGNMLNPPVHDVIRYTKPIYR